MGIECYILTGDNETVTKSIAGKLNLDGYFANVMPDKNRKRLKNYKTEESMLQW
jgi:P-type Cu2+ transporter